MAPKNIGGPRGVPPASPPAERTFAIVVATGIGTDAIGAAPVNTAARPSSPRLHPRERVYPREGVETAWRVVEGPGTIDVEASERAVPGRAEDSALESDTLSPGCPLAVDHALRAQQPKINVLLQPPASLPGSPAQNCTTSGTARSGTSVVCMGVTPESRPPQNGVHGPEAQGGLCGDCTRAFSSPPPVELDVEEAVEDMASGNGAGVFGLGGAELGADGGDESITLENHACREASAVMECVWKDLEAPRVAGEVDDLEDIVHPVFTSERASAAVFRAQAKNAGYEVKGVRETTKIDDWTAYHDFSVIRIGEVDKSAEYSSRECE
ncbi:hypothetical protein BV22DRAFT_1048417 [Leucogyrophana mollusca]|uniref:Uncharacterized protein n=1 Tax=Leucogyrophana mollusca TaxID=85980 RepID=A0ACB8BCS9_9AGAM|nr:hypothetical protein BV22DRAFT_1048417 [Leucogyrophana mollusca]